MLRFWPKRRAAMAAPASPLSVEMRTETDTFGPIEVPADRYWGAQAQRSLGNFKIGWEKQPKSIVRALGIVKRAAAEANMALGRLDPQARQGDRGGRAGGDRRQARRAFSAGRLADRLGHAIQHERQRGDLEPRDRDAGRRDGLQEARASQRPRQHEPVVERHLPDGHAHRLRRGDARTACCRRCAICRRRSIAKQRALGRTSSRSAARTRRMRRR